MLLEEGVYSNYCDEYMNDEDESCEKQESRVQLLFTVGTVVFCIGSVPVGIFLDRFGRALTMFFGLTIVSLSSFIFSFSDPNSM